MHNEVLFYGGRFAFANHIPIQRIEKNVERVLAENIACGLTRKRRHLLPEPPAYETSELYLYLNMLAYKGEAGKTTTFKDKVRQHPENVNAGLLTYPVLMATDILIHRASYVPVGKDQEQHLEMARNFASVLITAMKCFSWSRRLLILE